MDQAKLPHGNEETFQDFNIEFRHVDFKYDDNFVLKDFSLTLHQNKTYALIGSSGGGKSTIAKLISGFLSCRWRRNSDWWKEHSELF